MPADGALFTEVQHLALLESAIKAETAKLADEKAELVAQVETLTSEKAALAAELEAEKTRADVLEAEKATAAAEAEAARKEMADFKAELEREKEVASLLEQRVERVKAANSALPEAFFTEERQVRWAEMAAGAFDAFVADLTESAAAVKPADDSRDLAKESAAFSGGRVITSAKQEGVGLVGLLAAKRGAPFGKEG